MADKLEKHFTRYNREESVLVDGQVYTRQQDITDSILEALATGDHLSLITESAPPVSPVHIVDPGRYVAVIRNGVPMIERADTASAVLEIEPDRGFHAALVNAQLSGLIDSLNKQLDVWGEALKKIVEVTGTSTEANLIARTALDFKNEKDKN